MEEGEAGAGGGAEADGGRSVPEPDGESAEGSEESDETGEFSSSEDSEEEEEDSWLYWFTSLKGHEFFTEVDID